MPDISPQAAAALLFRFKKANRKARRAEQALRRRGMKPIERLERIAAQGLI